MKLVYQYMVIFSLIFHPLQLIFIHYKSWITTAIHFLLWMKMTMVNSGLKGLLLDIKIQTEFYREISLYDIMCLIIWEQAEMCWGI